MSTARRTAARAKATPPPPQVSSSLPFMLFGIGRLIGRDLEIRLADLGLSLSTLGVLGHLATSPQMSYSDLARRTDVTVQSIHTTVRRMITDGLITAKDTTGQATALTVTRQGRDRLEAAAASLNAFEQQLLTDAHLDSATLKPAILGLTKSAWALRIAHNLD